MLKNSPTDSLKFEFRHFNMFVQNDENRFICKQKGEILNWGAFLYVRI